jgi:hypothetical protein
MNRTTNAPIPAAVLAAVVLVGCARGIGPSAADDRSPAASHLAPTSPAAGEPGMPATPNGIPDAVWTAVITDLAQRTDARSIDPAVVSATAMTWNDGSLGCPEPGQMYTQALVDGYQIVLELDGERYDYRVGSGTEVKVCENGGLEGG